MLGILYASNDKVLRSFLGWFERPTHVGSTPFHKRKVRTCVCGRKGCSVLLSVYEQEHLGCLTRFQIEKDVSANPQYVGHLCVAGILTHGWHLAAIANGGEKERRL